MIQLVLIIDGVRHTFDGVDPESVRLSCAEPPDGTPTASLSFAYTERRPPSGGFEESARQSDS